MGEAVGLRGRVDRDGEVGWQVRSDEILNDLVDRIMPYAMPPKLHGHGAVVEDVLEGLPVSPRQRGETAVG